MRRARRDTTASLRIAMLVLASACAANETAPAKSEPAPTEPNAVTSEPAAEPVTPPADEVEATQVHAMPVLDLHPVVRSRSPLRMFTSTDGSLFVLANVEAIRIPESGPIIREPKWLAGIDDPGELGMVLWRPTAFGGRFPDALWLVVETQVEEIVYGPDVYRFAGTGWKRQPNAPRDLVWGYRGLTTWRDGSVLALRHWALDQREPVELYSEAKLAALSRDVDKKSPRAFEVLGAKGPAPSFGEADIHTFASLPSGEVVAIAGGESLHWAPGTTEPRRVSIAPLSPDDPGLVMFAADDVWMLDESGLARFDGTRWTEVPIPEAAAVVGFARAGAKQWLVHGSRWAAGADENTLYERVDDGPWKPRALAPIPFPADSALQVASWDSYELRETDAGEGRVKQPLVAMDVLAHRDELWVVARGPAWDLEIAEYRWALLHTRERGEPVEVPDSEWMRREILDAKPDAPFTGKQRCEVFVPIAVEDVTDEHGDLRSELATVTMPTGSRMALLEVVTDGTTRIGVAISVDVQGAAASRVLGEVVAGVREAIGPRAGKPICRPSIPRRVLDAWSEG